MQSTQEPAIEKLLTKAVIDLEKEDKFLAHLPDDSSRVEAQGFYRLAKIFYDKADFEKAEEYFLKSLELTETPQDFFAIFKIYGFLIRIYSESLDEERTEDYIKKSAEVQDMISRSLPSLNAEYFYNAAALETYLGKLEEAHKNFQQAHRKAQLENEPDLIAKSLYALATNAYQLQRFQEAIVYLNQLEQLLQILKRDYLQGAMHILWGNVKREIGEYKEALLKYDLAIKYLHSKRCWNMLNYILLNKGITYKKMGEFSKALIYFDIAQKSLDEQYFRRLKELLKSEVSDVNDTSVDIYLDRHNRQIQEKTIGVIDFKHRFVLLEILFLLAQNPGVFYNKEDLAKMIWKDEYNPLIHDKLIYTSISRLRKLVEPKGTRRKYILRGKDGYTFNPRANARFHNQASKNKKMAHIEISSPV